MNIILHRTADLSALILPETLHAPIYEGEDDAHSFVIHAERNGVPEPVTGSVVAFFERSDGNTVRIEGSNENGAACITLPAECYRTGVFYLAVMVVNDQAQTVIYAATGRVRNTQEGDIIDGGNAIPTYEEIMAHLNKYLNANLSAKVEQTPEGALITMTDADGTTTAFVKNGSGGGGGGNLPEVTTYDNGKILVVDNGQWTTKLPATAVEADNTLPITSAAVYTTVGNINALLGTI